MSAPGDPAKLLLGELASCRHPSEHEVVGLAEQILWCRRCGAFRRVVDVNWTVPSIAARAWVVLRMGGGS